MGESVEDKFGAESRIIALELLVRGFMTLQATQSENPAAYATEWRKAMIETLGELSWPAASDQIRQEVKAALIAAFDGLDQRIANLTER